MHFHKHKIEMSFNKEATVWHNDQNYTQVKDLTLNLQDAEKLFGLTVYPHLEEEFEELLDSYE
jgi:hypothetical protein